MRECVWMHLKSCPNIDHPQEKHLCMGLDLVVLDKHGKHLKSMRIGSYGYVQILRIKLIRATISMLTAQPLNFTVRHNSDDESDEDTDVEHTEQKERTALLEHLSGWLKLDHSSPIDINYNAISSHTSLPIIFIHAGIGGLIPFVHHSDCDGGWSTGQSLDIAILLSKLLPYFSLEEEEQNYFTELRDLFQVAAEREGYVTCC
jgi:hypothetical protein